jgi:simple sugar transport system permease protein
MMKFIKAHPAMAITATITLVISYAIYFIEPTKTESMYVFAWRFAIPLVLAAMVGVIGERSGVVNIGIEGQMLTSAFAGFFAAALSGSLVVGIFAGILTGILMGAFLAWTTVKWQMDQIIAGVVLNIVAAGITSFYYQPGQLLPQLMPKFSVPLLSDIPLIGPVFFERGFFGLATLVIVVVIQYALFRTRWGLRTRAIGEYPSAADTAGIDVIKMRLINVTLAGALAGCAGAYLSLEATSTFERGFTAGRGFLALAILIFGMWYPSRAMFAALFFGFTAALASQLQADEVLAIPQQFINTLPYVLTLIVLAVAAGRVRPPAAAGQPFVKGGS